MSGIDDDTFDKPAPTDGPLQLVEVEMDEDQRRKAMSDYLRDLADVIDRNTEVVYALHVQVSRKVQEVEDPDGGPWTVFVPTDPPMEVVDVQIDAE